MIVKSRRTRCGERIAVVSWDDGGGFGIMKANSDKGPMHLTGELHEHEPIVRRLARERRWSARRAARKVALALATVL